MGKGHLDFSGSTPSTQATSTRPRQNVSLVGANQTNHNRLARLPDTSKSLPRTLKGPSNISNLNQANLKDLLGPEIHGNYIGVKRNPTNLP